MKLAIVGGRTFKSYPLLCKEVKKFCGDVMPELIVSGGARGADRLAERYAKENQIKMKVLKPDWTKGRRSGLTRNTDIVNASTHVIAFVMPESRGTWDTIKKAQRKGIPVKIIRINNCLLN